MTAGAATVRVVLLHPRTDHLVPAATPEYVAGNSGCLPPMGLLYLQAAIEHSRHESVLLDANAEGLDHAAAARRVAEIAPDVVGIQAMTFTLPDAVLAARAIKQAAPRVKTVLGGPHPTIFPHQTAALDGVDYAFAGEGEVDFVRLLDAWGDQAAEGAVPGVARKADGGVHFTPSAGLLKNLDALPLPARRSSPYRKYHSVLAKRNPITVMITSRGCPFDCVFCNRMGRKYRAHSAERVLAEFDDIAQMGIAEVFIHDDTFTLRRDRVEAICRGLIERKPGLIWEARTRVDCVDGELLHLMRRAGCTRLSFGVESGSPAVLKAMRKGIELDRVKEVFRLCRTEGITTLADFMIGSLDERREDVEMSLELAASIRPDYVQYSICSPYPGTPLYAIGRETGLIAEDVWAAFARDPLAEFRSPVWTQHFTEEELVSLAAMAYRRFYMTPGRMLRQAAKVRSLKQLKGMAAAAWGMLRR
ncbi:MAG TPA: radical SAM protein [Phycisphaerae bacterium]|nr:radical SAM protein [Phycisphaerae bacterium]